MALISLSESGNIGNGGRMFQYGNYIVHEFRSDGMLWLPSNKTIDVLLVGGGGSGGPSVGDNDTGEGGGGAGGALWRTGYSISGGYYQIIIGQGGRRSHVGHGDTNGSRHISNNGGHTCAFGVAAWGGGCGGASDNHQQAQEGGCGGGGGARNGNGWNNGRGQRAQDHSGWSRYGGNGGNSAQGNYSGGGGGGIGGNGGNQSGGTNASNSQAGSGGAGRDFGSFFGRTVGHYGWFGGGGGGGTYRHGTNTTYQAPPNGSSSNYGGGGFGVSARESSQNGDAYAATRIDGMNGTGGGGGGGVEDASSIGNRGSCHGKGGDGAVVLRYAI